MDEVTYAFRSFLNARNYHYYTGADEKIPLFEASKFSGQRFFGFLGISEDMRVGSKPKPQPVSVPPAWYGKRQIVDKLFCSDTPDRTLTEEEEMKAMKEALEHLKKRLEEEKIPRLVRTMSSDPSELIKDPFADCEECSGCGKCANCFIAMEKHFTPTNTEQHGFPSWADYDDERKILIANNSREVHLIRDPQVWKYLNGMK